MTFRQVLFWPHLATELLCGAVIGILVFTGMRPSFEKKLTACFESDARQIAVPGEDALARRLLPCPYRRRPFLAALFRTQESGSFGLRR